MTPPVGTRGRVWRRSPAAVWRYTADGAVLLPVDQVDAEPTVVDSRGASVWQTLRTERAEDDVVDVVAHVYGMPVATVLPAVVDVLEELRRRGLVATDE